MAPVRRWVLAGAAACVAVALAYLPPRGAKPPRGSFFFAQAPRGTPARLRAQMLAEEWRAADAAVKLVGERRRLQDVVRRASGSGKPIVVLSDSASVPPAFASMADSAMQTAWRLLGLGETKVRVAAVLELAPTENRLARDHPAPEVRRGMFLAPDSTDRTTCIAVVPLGRYWTRVIAGDPRATPQFGSFVQMMKAGLGPCAFYAAYGTPGRSVRQWLVARGWDLGLMLDPGPRKRQDGGAIGMSDPGSNWYWSMIYSSLPPRGVGCLASRPAACRAAIIAGAQENGVVPMPDITRIDRGWWRTQQIAGGERFLADVASDVGRERFQTFWTTALPVDTALAATLKRPLGEWTAEWQASLIEPIRLGPTPRFGAAALALMIGALAVLGVAVGASRRQAR